MKKEVNMLRIKSNKSEQGSIDNTEEKNKTTMQSDGRIITDPLGSWTGTPVGDIFEPPVQDVDDL